MKHVYLMMHQFVFSFEVGWRLRFSSICLRNNGQ
jgi:hypothetical protein